MGFGIDEVVVKQLFFMFGFKSALQLYQQEAADPALLLPPASSEPMLADTGHTEPFPNVVYKLPGRDGGAGVYFLKATTPDHARALVSQHVGWERPSTLQDRLVTWIEDKRGLYQPYVRPSLLAGGQAYKIRALVLLTPVGVQFLEASCLISKFPIPQHLPFGMVQDPRPYLVNSETSVECAPISPAEEPAVKAAALAVARGLAWAVTYGFQTTSD